LPYHVRITKKSRRDDDALELDLSKDELLKRIVEPFRQGEPFMCGGEPIDPFDIEKIRINKTDEYSSELIPIIQRERFGSGIITTLSDEWYVTEKGRDETREFITAPPQTKGRPSKTISEYSNRVFIVHGRDDISKLELARLLENELGLNPIILNEQTSEGRTIIENIVNYSDVGYAFIIITPDDVGNLWAELEEAEKRGEKGILYKRPRQNVIFECGFFIGRLGRDRVCVLKEDAKMTMELPSDMDGIIFKPFKNSIRECYGDIVKELKRAGYELRI
jgi:predicted nucleotide-binding protein